MGSAFTAGRVFARQLAPGEVDQFQQRASAKTVVDSRFQAPHITRNSQSTNVAG